MLTPLHGNRWEPIAADGHLDAVEPESMSTLQPDAVAE